MKFIGPLSYLLFAMCSAAPSPEAYTIDVRPLAFVHVNVISMTQYNALRDQAVIVEKDRITQIGPAASIRLPRNAGHLHVRDKYLITAGSSFMSISGTPANSDLLSRHD